MLKRNGSEILRAEEVDHWRDILKLSENPTALEFAKAAKSAGDAVMYRMWTHVKSDPYDLSEQMSRETGK